jgi:hypothetical protein
MPLRKGPRPRLPTGGDNEAIKAKEPKVRQQVALTVSPAEATTSAVGSLTSGSDHLSTDDSGHLRTSAVPASGSHPSACKEVLAPVLTVGVRTRPSKNADAAPRRTTSCTAPRCGRRRGRSRGCGGPAHVATVARVVDGQPRPNQTAGGSVGGGAEAIQAGEPGTQRPAAPTVGRSRVPEVCLPRKAGERPSPPNAGVRSGPPAHAEGGTPTRLALLPSTDDEHQAEDGGEAVARLASLHHKAGGHPSR